MKGSKKRNSVIADNMLKYKWIFIFNIIMLFTVSFISVYTANYIRHAVDTMKLNTDISIKATVITVILVVIVAFFVNLLAEMSSGVFGINVIRDLKNELVSKLMILEFKYFDEKGSGSVISKFTEDMSEIQTLISHLLPDVLKNSITFAATFIYMLTINMKLLFLTVIVYPIFFAIMRYVSKKRKVLSQKRLEGIDAFNNVAKDSIEGMVIEKSYNLQEARHAKVKTVLDILLDYELRRQVYGALIVGFDALISWTPTFICCLFGAYFTFSGQMTSGELVAFVLLLGTLLEPMGEIPFLITEVTQASVAVKRIEDILNEPVEMSGEYKGKPKGIAISLKNIDFGYNEEHVILHNINSDVKTRSKIAVVGSSGGGKTTLFKLLSGLYKPNHGEYLLFGKDFKEWNLKAARGCFAIVSQDVFLFPETIEENVSYGRIGATHEEIVSACKQANIHEFISSLPDGYKTYVGERGIKLSGGECQRISIARAFLKNAPILLLDEPTSALDVNSEIAIQSSIDKLSQDKTVLTIAHRLSTIKNADEILVIDNGTIVERGVHKDLIDMKGVYSKLYETQMEVKI